MVQMGLGPGLIDKALQAPAELLPVCLGFGHHLHAVPAHRDMARQIFLCG